MMFNEIQQQALKLQCVNPTCNNIGFKITFDYPNVEGNYGYGQILTVRCDKCEGHCWFCIDKSRITPGSWYIRDTKYEMGIYNDKILIYDETAIHGMDYELEVQVRNIENYKNLYNKYFKFKNFS